MRGLIARIFRRRRRDHVVLIEAAPGSADAAAAALPESTRVTRLYWHPKVVALLPGTVVLPEHPAPGAGRLAGLPALVAGHAGQDHRKLLENARWLGLTEAEAEGGMAAQPPWRGKADQPPRRVFYWVGLTVTQPFNTGVQRVVRRLAVALARLGVGVVPVKWDEAGQCLAPLSPAEAAHLARWNGPVPGRPAPLPASLAGAWLLLPEITFPIVPAGGNQARFARGLGMRVAAVFHDLIPMILPELYPPEVLPQYQPYWDMLAEVDVVLPVSWTVAADIARYLAMRELRRPRITPCPLAGEFAGRERVLTTPVPNNGSLRLLAVGTWEPRKNYQRLLTALAAAQAAATRPIGLTIVGRRSDEPALDAEILALAERCGVTLAADLSDDRLAAMYVDADATVFASWEEGFGLPVLESLWHGRPCLCHDASAMAETAPGGGTLTVNMLDEAAIAAALVRLADEPGLVERLGGEAVARPIRDWDDYARDVLLALEAA